MADGFGAGDLFRSQILRQGLEDTPYPQQQIGGMMSGMQPAQLAAFFQSPQVQAQFKSFGIDPQAMLANTRQSPFFPNSFMQHHPLMGGMLNAGMANVAATPEAPLVSGAGSGMTRAMQGMYGGPEMLRHYQLQQMMAPMGALGAMMPTFGEQRRRAIEEAIIGRENEARKQDPQRLQLEQEKLEVARQRAEAAQATAAAQEDRAHRPTLHMGPIGTGILSEQYQPGQAPGVAGQREMVSPLSGQTAMVPGMVPGADPLTFGLSPGQQEGFTQQYTPYDQAAMEGQFAAKGRGLQTAEKGDELKSIAEKNRATAGLTRYKTSPEYRIAQEIGKTDQYFNSMREKIDDKYNPLITAEGADTENGKRLEQQRQNELSAAVANYLVHIQHAGGQITQEQQNWLQQYQQGAGKLPAQVAPGAGTAGANKPTGGQVGPGGQAGGAGSARSQGTATAPQATGLPPGYHFNEQGIPVPDQAQQAAPQQAPKP